jgi:hypothetical protein
LANVNELRRVNLPSRTNFPLRFLAHSPELEFIREVCRRDHFYQTRPSSGEPWVWHFGALRSWWSRDQVGDHLLSSIGENIEFRFSIG